MYLKQGVLEGQKQEIRSHTLATVGQGGILARTLTSDFWVDWALWPLSTRSLRLQVNQSFQGNTSTERVGHENGPFSWRVGAIRGLDTI